MKRFLAMLLAAVMVLGMLAACDQNKPVETKPQETQGNQPVETKPAETEPPKEDPVHLKWLTYGNIQKQASYDEVMEALNKVLLEKINVTVEIVGASTSELPQKADLAMSAGEVYDIMWVSNWLNDYATMVRKEALLPLEDLLAEYGQDLAAAVDKKYMDMCEINGVLYAIPCLQIMTEQQAILIQKQYADEYGLTIRQIDHLSELDDFFDWIVKKYPDLIPYCLSPGEIELLTNYESLGGGCYIKKDDPTNVVWDVATKFSNEQCWDYFQRGFFQDDILTSTDTSDESAANLFVSYQFRNKPGTEQELKAQYGVEWVKVAVGEPYLSSTVSRATALAIPYTSEHPEAAMKLLNLMFTDKEVYNLLMYGIEGKHYNKVSENRIEIIPDSGWKLTSYQWCYGSVFNAWLYGDQADDIHEQTQTMNDNSNPSPIAGFSFDTTAVAAEIAQVNAVNAEFNNFWFYEDHDERYQAWKEKMISAGIGTIVAECQRQLDEWRAATGN